MTYRTHSNKSLPLGLAEYQQRLDMPHGRDLETARPGAVSGMRAIEQQLGMIFLPGRLPWSVPPGGQSSATSRLPQQL